MAGPISHTVLAEKALATFLMGKDECPFIVGNLFPDIRYLKGTDRKSTHFDDVTLAMVQDERDPFKSGLLFHSLVDIVRMKYVRDHNAYADLPDSHLSTIALKICEDTALYPHSQRWPRYITYLDELQPAEAKFSIPIESIKQWHRMHQELFNAFSPIANKGFFYALGFDEQQVNEIFRLVEVITELRITDTYLESFYANLHDLLSEYRA